MSFYSSFFDTQMKQTFLILLETQCVMSCFSGSNPLRECFAKNRHVLFFWRLPCEKACDALPELMFERMHDVWKEYKYNPKDIGQCSCNSLLNFSGVH